MNKFLNSLLKTELINSSYIKYNLPIKNYFLIQWFPFSHTLIHGHDGKECIFFTLNGSLKEYKYSDKTNKNSLNLWIVSDNLLKGAALNAVEIAETLIKNKNYGKQ